METLACRIHRNFLVRRQSFRRSRDLSQQEGPLTMVHQARLHPRRHVYHFEDRQKSRFYA